MNRKRDDWHGEPPGALTKLMQSACEEKIREGNMKTCGGAESRKATEAHQTRQEEKLN